MSIPLVLEQGRRISDDLVGEWLYSEYDKTKLEEFQTLYHIPGIHQYFDYLLDKRSDQEYMKRYQLGYSDIHDPRKLSSTGSNITGLVAFRGVNFISSNVKHLYD